MKIFKRLASLALCGALVFTLAACQKDEGEDPVNKMTNAVAGLDADTVMLTVNGEDVDAEYYLYWLAYDCSYWVNYMSQYGVALDWEETFSDGTTNAQFLRQDAVDLVTYYLTVEQKAREEDCGLTEEQEEQFQADLADYIEESGGQEAYQADLNSYGISDETFQRINRFSYLYNNLMDKLVGEVDEATLNDYIEANGYYSAKHILLLTTDPATGESLDADTVAQKQAQADQLLTQIQSAEDPIATFDELMNEYSEDTGLASYPDGYVTYSGQMVSEFEETALSLEVGEISTVVESPYGYHIILRQDIPETDLEDIKDSCRSEEMQALVQQWVDEAEVTTSEHVDALDTETFYNNYSQYQQNGGEMPQETTSPEPSASSGT